MKRFLLWLFPQHPGSQKRSWRTHLHDTVLFLLVFAASIGVSIPLSTLVAENNDFAMSMFILAVALIARFTEGYVYGIAASVLAVLCVNYIFTYPYWAFNMSLVGYPLNFTAMLIVSMIISALTTQTKKQEQLRLDMEKEKTRADLLRSVSHDIRTPLTAIIGSSAVLLENEALSAGERRELVSAIHKDARWLTQITENILSITKISGDRMALKKEAEVLEEIVGSAIGKLRKQYPAMAVSVRKPDEILLVPMDATLIEQVLLNLLGNAAAHGKNTTKITIAIEAAPDEVRVTVADNGGGISPQALPGLFDGSAASQAPYPDAKRHMGIGLSVCRSIVKAHGGSIHAANRDGGASITFTLPTSEEEI